MEMINRCLLVSPTTRAQIERRDQQEVDIRHIQRKAMIAERKERRRQAALARQGKELA